MPCAIYDIIMDKITTFFGLNNHYSKGFHPLTKEWEDYLIRERTGGGKLLADEIASGNVGDAEELRKTASEGAFPNAGTSQEHPLNVPILSSPRRRIWATAGRQPNRETGNWLLGEDGEPSLPCREGRR